MSPYTTYLAVLTISALAAFFLSPFAKRLALRWGAMDVPDARKLHDRPMPRLGGAAVFFGFCSPWLCFYFLDNRIADTFVNYEKFVGAFMLGAFFIFLLGVYDDVKGANAAQKFTVQILIASVLWGLGFRIEQLTNPFGPAVSLGWLSLPCTVLWIAGITNSVNLLDGIDGLATGVTACIALTLAVINILADDIVIALLTLALAGSCLGFLPHNFSPARIFLGDSGSLFLGYALACISVISLFKAATAAFIIVPILLFGLPLADTISVMIQRLYRSAPLFSADQSHVHHWLARLGWTHKKISYILYGVTVFFGVWSVLLTLVQSRPLIYCSLALLLLFIFIYFKCRRGSERRLPVDPSRAAKKT